MGEQLGGFVYDAPPTTAGRKCEVDVLQHGAFGGQDDVLVQNLPAECPR